MQVTRGICRISTILILILSLAAWSAAQSGRGRPKVPTPESAAPPPPPVEVPAATSVVAREQAGNISRFVLRNGMIVIISEQHATPLVAVAASFKAAAAGTSGGGRLRRLVQQVVMAGGTSTRRPGQIYGEVRALGGTVSSGGSYDSDYFLTVAPGEKIKEVLALQSDMLQHPALPADEVNRAAQLLSVKEESRCEDPVEDATDRLIDLTLQGGPGAGVEPPGGDGRNQAATTRDQVAITREQVAKFCQENYRPANLVITVAGDVSTFDVLVGIERLYGEFGTSSTDAGASHLETVRRDGSAERGKLAYVEGRGDINQSIVTLGYPILGTDGRDFAAVEVLSALIGQGRGSLLNRHLLLGQGVVSRVESDYMTFTRAGLLLVRMWVTPQGIDKAEAAACKEIAGLRGEQVAPAELERARAIAEKMLINQGNTYSDRALTLARDEISSPGLKPISGLQQEIRSVTAEAVQRVAARYLALGNTSIYEYESYSAPARTFDAARFAETVVAWAPGLAQPVALKVEGTAESSRPSGPAKQVPASPQARSRPVSTASMQPYDEKAAMESMQPLPIKDFSILNGPRLYVREDHSRPQVTVAILFEGGRVVEDETNSGITELMLRSMLYGTAHRTPEQAAIRLDELGAEVRVVVEPDCYGFVLSALSARAGQAVRLLRDLIENPAFREEDIERARSEQIGAIRQARDDIAQRSRGLLFQAIFSGYAYGLPVHGAEESVAKVKSEALQAWYGRTVKVQFPLVIIVGNTAGSALASEGISEGFKRRETVSSLQVRVPRPQGGLEKGEQRRCGVSVLSIGSAGPKGDSADLPAIELMQSMMNGPGGRLSSELVNKQALAVEPSMACEPMLAGGAIYFYAATSPASEARVRSALTAEIARLANGTAGADELARARSMAAAGQMARLQSQIDRALEYARAIFSKRPPSEVDSYSETLSRITADEVKRAAATYLKPARLDTAVVRGAGAIRAETPSK